MFHGGFTQIFIGLKNLHFFEGWNFNDFKAVILSHFVYARAEFQYL